MKVYIEKDNHDAAKSAYRFLKKLLVNKPNATLAVVGGKSPGMLFKELIHGVESSEISFKDSSIFQVDEYVGLSESDPNLIRNVLNTQLFNHIDIQPEKIYSPQPFSNIDQSIIEYENMINQYEIDLMLLGVSEHGLIGFNEVGHDLESKTHLAKLSNETKQEKVENFGSVEEVPDYALTLGISNIMKAKQIMVMVCGEHKQEALFQLVKGAIAPDFPCSVLQKHPSVVVICDEKASQRLHE